MFLVNQEILPSQFSLYNQIVVIFNPDIFNESKALHNAVKS